MDGEEDGVGERQEEDLGGILSLGSVRGGGSTSGVREGRQSQVAQVGTQAHASG